LVKKDYHYSRTHGQQNVNIWKTEDFAPNDSNHSLTSVGS